MTIVEPPDVESPPLKDLDAGVIEEAKARERRHRGFAAAAVLAAVIGALVATSLGGGGSSHTVLGPTRPAPSPAKTAPTTLTVCDSPSRNTTTDGVPSQSLLSILGVLRRPATPADTLPATILAFFTSESPLHAGRQIFINYIRRARVISGTSYYLIPVLNTGCGRLKITGEGIQLWQQRSGGGGYGGGDADATRIEQAQAVGFSAVFTHSTITMIVPDGVATATLHYPAGKVGGFNRNHAPPVTITTNVTGNILVATIPRGGMRLMAPMTMTWRAANGTTIKTFHTL